MRPSAAVLLAASLAAPLNAFAAETKVPQLFCHRTANEDMPENTLESLEQAALLGCNLVEIDLRRTQDGQIVLNHDGILERLTDGIGEVKSTNLATLDQLDLGTWMSPRFAGMHIARFEDALRIARTYRIRLVLDIKDKGIGNDILRLLDQEGMREQVQFGGEWQDVKELLPTAKTAGDEADWVQPGVTADQVSEQHRKGKFVVANFSANDHGMDLAGMRAAVAAGVDAINVDYPRLGADAIGRPVEEKLHALIQQADSGSSKLRADAVRTLALYQGFPLEAHFKRWLADADPGVSRTAAEALVNARPRPEPTLLLSLLQSPLPAVRANTAWLLSQLKAPSSTYLPLLNDKDPLVLEAALIAIAQTPGEIDTSTLLPLLANGTKEVRGAAARALAIHQPASAVAPIATQLDKEVSAERKIYDDRQQRGNPPFTQPEIDTILRSFRCQMQMVRALASIPGDEATRELIHLAMRPDKDFSQYNAIISSFQLWDRIAVDPQPLIDLLGSENNDLAERAEWTLTHASPRVLPAVRLALLSSNAHTRMRAMHILAWQADEVSIGPLRAIASSHSPDAPLASWAIAKILDLHPTP